MTSSNEPSPPMELERGRYEVVLDWYLIGLSVVMMLLGLHQWAVILGITDGAAGSFEAMSEPWKIATMYLSVVDLVAAVGLWMRVAWGKVVWLLAAVSEIALHTVFFGTYGSDVPIVILHLATIVAFGVLAFMARRY
jgi:hypothetical protein